MSRAKNLLFSTSMAIGAAFEAKNKITDKAIAKYLKVFLFLDTDQLIYDKQRSPWSKLKYNISRFVTWIWTVIFFGRIIGFERSDKQDRDLDRLGDMFQVYFDDTTGIHIAAMAYCMMAITFPAWTSYCQSNPANHSLLRYQLIPLDVIAGRIAPRHVGISIVDQSMLRKQMRRLYLLSFNAAIGIPGTLAVYTLYMTLANGDLDRYLLNLIAGWFHYNVWVLLNMSLLSTCVGYFYLVCLFCKIQIKGVNDDIDEHIDGNPNQLTIAETLHLLRHHNNCCNGVKMFDKYWSRYILATYVTFLPLNASCVYLVILSTELFNQFLFAWIFLQLFGIMSFTMLSAASIADSLMKTHKKIYSLIGSSKFDVRLKKKIFKSLMRFESDNKLGFTCVNFFVVTYASYGKVVMNIIAFFLLLMSMMMSK